MIAKETTSIIWLNYKLYLLATVAVPVTGFSIIKVHKVMNRKSNITMERLRPVSYTSDIILVLSVIQP